MHAVHSTVLVPVYTPFRILYSLFKLPHLDICKLAENKTTLVMDGEDYRTGSADSENGSDNSYVQVTHEDVPPAESDPSPPIPPIEDTTSTDIPSVADSEDIYGDDGDQDHEKTLGAEEASI